MTPLSSYSSMLLSPLNESAHCSFSISQKKVIDVAGFAIGCLIVYVTFKRSCALKADESFPKKLLSKEEGKHSKNPRDIEQTNLFPSVSKDQIDSSLIDDIKRSSSTNLECSIKKVGVAVSETLSKFSNGAGLEGEVNDLIPTEETSNFERTKQIDQDNQNPQQVFLEQADLTKKEDDQLVSLETFDFEMIGPFSSSSLQQSKGNSLGKLIEKIWQNLPFWR